MSAAVLAYLEDDLPMPRRARHLYLVAVDGRIIEHATPPDTPPENRSRTACVRTGTSALAYDTQGNTTSVEYDNLGRRTAIDNPDTGKVETVFDLASNPIKKITANLRAMGADKAIEYDYDHTRLIAIRHPLYPDANVSYTYGTDADRAHNQAGRIKSVTHQSGTETREYGSLGETVSETLTLTAAANGGSTPPVYTTQYNFDSFGRLHTVTNPDGEVITHHYDSGGNLNSIDGRLNGHPYQYLERLDYDKFEQRVYLKVGNGVETKYAYDKDNRRLETLKAGSPGKGLMQDMTYGYDNVGNIKSLIDSAPIPKSNVYGGKSTQHFDYDDLYRLVKADGVYTTVREEQKYTLAMAYDAIHNITHKNQLHTVGKVGGTSPKTETATTYDWGYTYEGGEFKQPHAPTHIGERTFDYDANGNQRGWQNDTNGSRRTIVWDEENRIREVQDPKHGAAFTYDDKGERKLRKSQYGETAYINQYFSVRNGAIASTHVYAGTSRIVTKVGAGTPVGKVSATTIQGTGNLTDPGLTAGDTIVITADGTTTTGSATTSTTTSTTLSPASGRELERGQSGDGNFPGQGLEHRSDRANEVARNTEKNKHLNGGDPGGIQGSANSNKGGHGNAAGTSNNPGADTGTGGGDTGGGSGTGGNTGGNTGGGAGTGDGMEFIYFYHPDHLGSTGYVTDEKALRYEHITYFPFGETWVQEATATWRVPYQFTGKEMDPETGLYYFGARYYDPRTSVWQSVDPILGKYLPNVPNKEGEIVKLLSPTVQQPLAQFNLPGMGGVFNSVNLGMYTYAGQNPVKYVDPDGRETNTTLNLGLTDIGIANPHLATLPGPENGNLSIAPIVGGSQGNISLGASFSYDLIKPIQINTTSSDTIGNVGTRPSNIKVPVIPDKLTLPNVVKFKNEVLDVYKALTPAATIPGQPQQGAIEGPGTTKANTSFEYSQKDGMQLNLGISILF